MAVFYFPTRGAPTTTLTIGFLETKPKPRVKRKAQSRDLTPGLTPVVYDLGTGTITTISILIRQLTAANNTSLDNFIENIINYSSSSFDFDDDNGNQFDTVYYWQDTINEARPEGIDLFNKEMQLLVTG
jgi:hypothetical protein